MKSFILIVWVLFFLASGSICQAQDVEKTRIYETRSNIAATPCDVLGTKFYKDDRFHVPPYKGRFAVVKYIKDKVVVRFLNWSIKDSTESDKLSPTPLTDSTNKPTSASIIAQKLSKEFNGSATIEVSDTSLNKELLKTHVPSIRRDKKVKITVHRYFLITKGDLDSNCVKVYSSGKNSAAFTLGLVTMPMKIRLGNKSDFQSNLSLGTTAGVKMRLSKYNPNYANILVGLSLGSVPLDSFSTGGKISGQPLTNVTVFSPSLGFVAEFGRAQIGAFIGIDYLNAPTQQKYEWIYNRKPWLSIGFGFSIFNVDSKSSNSQPSKQTPVVVDN